MLDLAILVCLVGNVVLGLERLLQQLRASKALFLGRLVLEKLLIVGVTRRNLVCYRVITLDIVCIHELIGGCWKTALIEIVIVKVW